MTEAGELGRGARLRGDPIHAAAIEQGLDAVAGVLNVRRAVAMTADWAARHLGEVALVDVLHGELGRDLISVTARRGQRDHVVRDGLLPHEGPAAIRRAVLAIAQSFDDDLGDLQGGLEPTDDAEGAVLGGDRWRWAAGAPLRARGDHIGTITVAGATPELPEGVLAALDRFARRVSVSIDNARLYEDRSRVALTLQRALLPADLPEPAGYELGAVHRPARSALEISGDFYDVFEVEGGWMAVVGDVQGKGAGAAALTGLTRSSLRTAASLSAEPEEVVLALNRAVLANGGDRFCTVVVAKLADGGQPDIRLTSGGHLPPAVVRHNGEVEFVRMPGMLIGAFSDPTLVEVATGLGAGDAIVLYTDGVTEARAFGEEFGEARLRAVLAESAGMPAQVIAERVAHEVSDFTGGALQDDLAVLVVSAAR